MANDFEWDNAKNTQNVKKHGISFEQARHVFFDKHRIIVEDLTHSVTEKRYFCFGKYDNKILTVRFTHRGKTIRIFGAAYWRKGVKIYEKENG